MNVDHMYRLYHLNELITFDIFHSCRHIVLELSSVFYILSFDVNSPCSGKRRPNILQPTDAERALALSRVI